MNRCLATSLATIGLVAAAPAAAFAQSGHFVQAQDCRDVGTTVECSGKVAGLGGETFEITVAAEGRGTVECTNPGGNVAPGQTFDTTISGSSGPLETTRNGRFLYTVTTGEPVAPADACPNEQWTATVTDVEFTEATITLLEDGVVSDSVTVPVG